MIVLSLHMESKYFNSRFPETEALTYDDVLLVPAQSSVLPREVDISSRFSTNIKLNLPVATAAMDTVTDKRMAIAIARVGGIGIIHKNMSIQEQADQVRSVKRSESGMIQDPVTVHIDALIKESMELMAKYHIGGIPVIDGANKLVGILTNRDLRFEVNPNKRVRDLMTSEKLITAPVGTTLMEAREILQKHKIEKLPVVRENGELAGLITYKDIMKLVDYPSSNKDAYGRLIVGAAVGVSRDTFDRVEALDAVNADVICIDTAHGHSAGVLKTIKELRRKFPNLEMVGGNVATAAGTQALIDAGVNAVKVGVGPGSICTTRVVAGVGVPQLTAVMLAAEVAAKSGIPIIADGGIRYTGDFAKALAAGADAIMAGSLFAGTDEAPGETIIYEGRKFKVYRGMGSIGAMQLGSKDRYFQDVEDDIKKLVPEGIEGRVPYKGTLEEVMVQFTGGLRAGMGYVGAKNIEELKKAEFVRISNSGIAESHPHHITITKEAPNYSRR